MTRLSLALAHLSPCSLPRHWSCCPREMPALSPEWVRMTKALPFPGLWGSMTIPSMKPC